MERLNKKIVLIEKTKNKFWDTNYDDKLLYTSALLSSILLLTSGIIFIRSFYFSNK